MAKNTFVKTMKKVDKYLKVDELEEGAFYWVTGRNIRVAQWITTKKGLVFEGPRTKFNQVFLDAEYHWDEGPPFGTCRPIRKATPDEVILILKDEVWKKTT